MLKEFRSIDVYWDKATRRIYEEIRSSSSDEKGRKLTVQIVNDGQIQDLTNVALNLYWETQDGENRGLDPFEPIDPENGIYELYFRTGMLKHVGKLNAHLHLVDTTGAITSEPFTIFVFEGVDVDAMASDDELSALNQALIEVQNITQDEAERVSAETERITAEEERVSNENERKTAETTRNTNETTRVSNETDRVNAEDTRNTNETNRVDAESNRVTAETARVTAEEEREQGYPALDGRLTTVEQNIVENHNQVTSHLAEKASKSDLEVERSRINAFTTLSEGSTTADAELLDIRVKADGTTATSAGDAVREQVSELKGDLAQLNNYELTHTQSTEREYFPIKLIKGKKYEFFIVAGTGATLKLSTNENYSDGEIDTVFDTISVDRKLIYECKKDYKSALFWQSATGERSFTVRMVADDKTTEIPLNKNTLVQGCMGENTMDIVTDANSVTSPIIEDEGFYFCVFPDTNCAVYSIINEDGQRINISSSAPFSFKNKFTARVTFKLKTGKAITPSSNAFFRKIRIYKVTSAYGEYDVSVANYNSEPMYKEKASIVCEDGFCTRILASIFGSYHSIRALIYPAKYEIDTFYTMSATSKCAIPLNEYVIDGGSKRRRLITVHGFVGGSPQTEDSVKMCVSQDMHNSIAISGINYFLIASPYDYGTKIQRASTSVEFKNFNVIGYKYDKPITYIDTSRCLSSAIENVNVRSWSEHLNDYVAFDETPNAECCGIRVGRGSNYGIGNYVKHLNVWYCGKGIACNGEHFIFEDVKTHHDYIGWYFGDKSTVGNMEHTNTMIGCSIEGCYRLMVLSKNGVITEQDFVKDDTNNMLRSTLDVFSLSTEKSWIVPTNEDNGGTKQTTLPILEIVKGAYRGRMELENYKTPFEEGSGANFIWIAWSANGVNTSNYIDFSAIN